MASVLVTGGAGYIGSHTCVALMEAGWEIAVLDSLENSSSAAVDAVAEITGHRPRLEVADCRDEAAVEKVITEMRPDAVLHFAGLKSVPDSVADPLRYYRHNLESTAVLMEVMQRGGVRRMVFSSSATVYGPPDELPVSEAATTRPVNPYGWTKLLIEQMIADVVRSDPRWSASLLRYFNPVGAHPSGLIGEDPEGVPGNLMPYLLQVAVGRRDALPLYGTDYPTPDGTAVRDYIHVMDLAEGHLAALQALESSAGQVHTYNLGTGRGASVLEVIAAMREATGHPLPYEELGRRPGDVPELWADPAKARSELGWSATRSLAEMCRDGWAWQSKNPQGYS
ncbi:MAG: UDP-glucose 4-epimerase GalE [Acidimicrobiia bacterium]|nr:UDP-glucose 4-epimerase GalE [bacterium]MXW58562.1 UDP-glucose 4-epimerase GalE [Acidimicrobiia bacterium]MYB73509.1 UDP-glucose 4-epimerase GalE [Acidimicrobiia bacterium]MYI00064.1 UDP-glucose 4-epimerase GalE [Acidimicrobiia bacterium]